MRPLHAARQHGLLSLLTAASLLLHGYHFGCEDQDVYISAANKAADRGLYPFNAGFFVDQMRGMGTHFDQLIGAAAHGTHTSVALWALIGHVAAIYLIYLALYRIGEKCFRTEAARWSGLLLTAGLLTLPVAGTRLFLIDQYLHPRALATAGAAMAIAAALNKRWLQTAGWLVFAFLMHPLMMAFGLSFILILSLSAPKFLRGGAAMAMTLPFLAPVTPEWREAVMQRSFYFLWKWEWYELLGAAAPLVIVWAFANLAKKKELFELERLCRRLVVFGCFQFVVALAMTLPPQFIRLACYEPMRWLHLYYLLFGFVAGGLAGELLWKKCWARWAMIAALVSLCAGMFVVQRQLFPESSHLEFGLGDRSQSANEWARAYEWIRANTPRDAYFAMDAKYMEEDGQDHHGFRVLAERSMMAEKIKDPGAAAVFPKLLPEWRRQVQARENWREMSPERLRGLHAEFGVGWAVLTSKAGERLPQGLEEQCRYRSPRVCVAEIR